MRRSPDVSPRRLSDISPQLRQLKYLVVDEAIKEDLKWSRSVEDLTSASVGLTSIEERILRITGYYGYQPWAASYKREDNMRAVKLPFYLELFETGRVESFDNSSFKTECPCLNLRIVSDECGKLQ
ncbi:hypothetical protein Q9233_005762 [Columba guinea]|nr:hypothetical protein Q9233_005762 [Columba guinea]